MSLVKWAFIGVLLLPAAEFAAFVLVALVVGWLWAALLFLGTTAAGLLILRRAGRRDFDRFRSTLGAQGIRAINLETPGLATMVGGILLVLPGFITDVAGALLLWPLTRRFFGSAIGRAQSRLWPCCVTCPALAVRVRPRPCAMPTAAVSGTKDAAAANTPRHRRP